MSVRNISYAVLGIAISAFFLYLSLKNVSLDQLKAAFSRSNPYFIIPVFLGILSFYWLKAVRCCILLSPAKQIPVRQLFPYMMAGINLNHFVLGQAGDLARMYLVGSRIGLKYSTVAASILLEWAIDLAVILLLLFAMAPFKTISYDLIYHQIPVSYIIGALLILFAAGAVIYWKTGARLQHWEHALLGFRSLTKGRLLFQILAISLLMWVMMGCSHYFAMKAAGLSMPLEAPIVLILLIIISIFLPSAPARIGVIELSYVLGLAPFGVDAPSALVAALFYHGCLSLSILLLGLYSWKYLLLKQKKEHK